MDVLNISSGEGRNAEFYLPNLTKLIDQRGKEPIGEAIDTHSFIVKINIYPCA